MPEVKILKDVNKKTIHDSLYNMLHTIRINVAHFTIPNTGALIQYRERKDVFDPFIGWMKNTDYTETINTQWESIFPPGSSIDRISKILTLTGVGSLKTKAMYLQTWSSTTPVEINLEILFEAEKSAKNDVIKPCRYLQQYVSPIERSKDEVDKTLKTLKNLPLIKNLMGLGGEEVQEQIEDLIRTFWGSFLLPPVGSAINTVNFPAQGYDAIDSIEIGNFITLKDIVLENVSIIWHMDDVDINGDPLSATANVTVRSRNVWTNQTIANLLNSGSDIIGEVEVLNLGGALQNFAKIAMKQFKDTFDQIFGE